MRSLNKVMLIGRLGKDPELQNFESGAKKVTFSLATSEKFTNRAGNVEEATEWHNIVMWNKTAEIAAQYLRKGDPLYIEGKITYRSWDDNEGNKRYMTEVRALSMIMLGSKNDRSSSEVVQKSAPPVAKTEALPPAEEAADDLPF